MIAGNYKGDVQSYAMSDRQLRDAFDRACKYGYAYLVTTTEAEGMLDGVIIHELPFEIRGGYELDDLREMHNKHGRLYFKNVFDLNQPFEQQLVKGLENDQDKMTRMPVTFQDAVDTVLREKAYERQPRWKRFLGFNPKIE